MRARVGRVAGGKGVKCMAARTTTPVSAAVARSRLDLLLEEREAAMLTPLGANRVYMDDLEADIATSRAAFVGCAVTEIATLRAAVTGPLQG